MVCHQPYQCTICHFITSNLIKISRFSVIFQFGSLRGEFIMQNSIHLLVFNIYPFRMIILGFVKSTLHVWIKLSNKNPDKIIKTA